MQGAALAVVADEAALAPAKRELRLLLELAYSGELGAAWAYLGHSRALKDGPEREEVARICRDELRHRQCLLSMIHELGGSPDERRERKLSFVGHSIAWFCRWGGWFFPMYGAAKLEAQNIREYELAARLAYLAGLAQWVDPLLEMAEVEWDHERYFRQKAQTHLLWSWVPHWPLPPAREEIRAAFEGFCRSGDREVPRVHAPLLIR